MNLNFKFYMVLAVVEVTGANLYLPLVIVAFCIPICPTNVESDMVFMSGELDNTDPEPVSTVTPSSIHLFPTFKTG